MKFISKSTNLLIVLRAGLPAQPMIGMPGKPNISVRFKDGVADVQQQELIDMMLAHPGFNVDYIAADSVPVDPFVAARKASEPAHEMIEMKYGTPENRQVGGGDPTKLTPEMQKLVKAAAEEMAKAMLPSMVEHTLKTLVADRKEAKAPGKKRGRKPGRKPKAEVPEIIAENMPAQPEETQIKDVLV